LVIGLMNRCAVLFACRCRAAARFFLLRRQKKEPKEKAPGGCSKPRLATQRQGAAELALR